MKIEGRKPELIAARIVEIVRSRSLRCGEHLKEESFAAELGVSRSPVRKAFALLQGCDVLVQEPNHGYFLSVDAGRIDPERLPFGSDPLEDLYLQVADDLLSQKIPDEFYETLLMRQYDLGRGQLVKLLGRLAADGLLVRKPGNGWKVNPFLKDADAHDQSYRFRMAFEPTALLQPTFRVDKEAFQRTRELQLQLVNGDVFKVSRPKLFQFGAQFHEMLMRCSGNRYFLEAIQRQNQLRRLLEYRSKANRKVTLEQCCQHLELLDLIVAGKRKQAAEFLHKHLDAVRRKKTGKNGD
ncbi:MAG: GntR family transcriptional regulator [Candidatus Korobacteraceae bacterium]|jgi:DNA-binding GntR family transcriptional regulator